MSMKTSFRAVDFFCGAGGMSYGLLSAGIEILAGIDNDAECRKTYVANIRNSKFIKRDISRLSAPELGRRLDLAQEDDRLIFAGCSPCQYWSKIRTDKSKSEKSAFLLKNFERFIKYFRPGFIIIENVPGLLTNKAESILPEFLKFLASEGYAFKDGVVDAHLFGVPQHRSRYLLIASRLVPEIELPPVEQNTSKTIRDVLGVENGFKSIPAGHRDTSKFQHTAAALSEKNLRRIQLTSKSGGTRVAWEHIEELQIPAYIGRKKMFRDVYSRMSWDRPSPTITTRFNSFSNGRFGHPEEDRAISLREGATLQTFPKKFVFKGTNMAHIARQIGNAVPPVMAKKIGLHILDMMQNG